MTPRPVASSLIPQRRDDTDLLHQAEQRRDAPVLGDPTADDPHGVDAAAPPPGRLPSGSVRRSGYPQIIHPSGEMGEALNTAGRRRAMGRSIPMPIRGLSQTLERARTEQGEIVRVESA